VSAAIASPMEPGERGANLGWILGFVTIALVLAIGAGLWFTFHP